MEGGTVGVIRNMLLLGLSLFSPVFFVSCNTEPADSVESSYAEESTYEVQETPQTLHFSKYQILAVNGFLLGGYHKDQWIGCDALYPMIAEEEEYKIYIDGQYRSTEKGEKEPGIEDEMYCGPSVKILNSDYNDKGEADLIAFSGERDLAIDAGTKISPENQMYREINQSYIAKLELKELGSEEEFELRNVIKVDIDNDRKDEIILQSFRYEDPIHESMGIQYMRKIVDGEVVEFMIPIVSPAVPSDQIRIIGFCDLNGDGMKELLMSSSGTGYSSYMVYEFRNNEFRRIFENGAER